MHIISNNYDERNIKISFNKNDKSDAIIINDSCKNDNQIIEVLSNSLENAIMVFRFDDLYYIFRESGFWKYECYKIKSKEIENFVACKNHSSELFVVFYIGQKVQFSQIEDILENILVNNYTSEIMFSCCLDTKLEFDDIEINIFNKIDELMGNNEKMINNMDEFIKEHPYAVIVNYDIANKFDCGKIFRTNKKTVEEFRKDKRGNYIKFPYIQPYLTLSELSSYELFIIHDRKIYQLELGNSDNSYKIKKEITNINFDIGDDDIFYIKRKTPKVINEDTWIIEE